MKDNKPNLHLVMSHLHRIKEIRHQFLRTARLMFPIVPPSFALLWFSIIAVAVAVAVTFILRLAIGRGFKNILLGTRLASLPQPRVMLFLLVVEHGFEVGYSVPGRGHWLVDWLKAYCTCLWLGLRWGLRPVKWRREAVLWQRLRLRRSWGLGHAVAS